MRPLSTTDPTTVASYRLVGVLGSGGMGRVYLGHSPSGERLAIKVIRAELAEDPVFRRRFAREVAAIRAINPLFTAAVVDADPEAESPWLATTFIDGPSLDQWVDDQGPLAPSAVLTLAAGLAEALASIHEAGLVHRDLKPANVLIDDTGPHIIDFGIALLPDTTRLTTSLVGTPSYMAPERLHGNEAGPAADIFSLGATLAFAATGRRMVGQGTMYEQIIQISAGRFDLSGVPREVLPLVEKCISHKSRDRPTAAALVQALGGSGRCAPGPGWHTSRAPVSITGGLQPFTVRFSRRRVLAVGGGALVLAAAGAGTAVGLVNLPTHPAMARPGGPGRVLWQLRTGARPIAPAADRTPDAGLANGPAGPLIVVDRGERIITADGAQVYAQNVRGAELWRQTLPAGVLDLRLWGDAVLAVDARRLCLLDAETGRQRFAIDAAHDEVTVVPRADAGLVRVFGLALSAGAVFVDLVTAIIAVDRTGRRLWRSARPAGNHAVTPTAGNPRAAGDSWLVTSDCDGADRVVSLVATGTGRRRWSTRYPAPVPLSLPSPGPGGAGGPSGSAGGDRRGPPPPPPAPATDSAWQRSESRIDATHLMVRDAQDIRALRLADGGRLWQHTSPTPIAAIEILGDLLVIAADRIYACRLDDGERVWQAPLRGARIAVTPDGQSILATDGRVFTALTPDGRTRWEAELPRSVADALPDQLSTDDSAAYLTFRALPERRDPLDIDVVAIALNPTA